MAGITVDDNGKTRVITDTARLLAEQADIVARLERIYAGFKERPAGALDQHEPIIVALVNRYNQLGDWIDQLTTLEKRRANIDAGFELLERVKGSQP